VAPRATSRRADAWLVQEDSVMIPKLTATLRHSLDWIADPRGLRPADRVRRHAARARGYRL